MRLASLDPGRAGATPARSASPIGLRAATSGEILSGHRSAALFVPLLPTGRHVSSPEGVGPEQWRAQIRAQARRDKIRVVTFRDGDRAIAARNRTASDDELRYELERMRALGQLAAAARALGHESGSWLRSDEESISLCSRCEARIYLRVATPRTELPGALAYLAVCREVWSARIVVDLGRALDSG